MEAAKEETGQLVRVQEREEVKVDPASLKSSVLGDEDCPVEEADTEIYYQEVFRILKIENLGKCTGL
jgi:hypothetical protein